MVNFLDDPFPIPESYVLIVTARVQQQDASTLLTVLIGSPV